MKTTNHGRLVKRQRHDPLHQQLGEPTVGHVSTKAAYRKKYQAREERRGDPSTADAVDVDEKLSGRIFQQAREQLAELEDEDASHSAVPANIAYVPDADDDVVAESADSDDDGDYAQEQYSDMDDDEYDVLGADSMQNISESDRAALAMFMPDRAPERRNLADVIMQKIQEQQQPTSQDNQSDNANNSQVPAAGLDPRVVQVYTKVGLLLSRYRSGKLPKAFKIISALANWEEIMYITKPESWTPNAMFQATRLFASNLKPKMAQRFFNLILLEAVRQDIQQSRKVNHHYYMALKKALYKPAAFFKGILLPLCEEGTCTLREAIIMGSVLSKVSIPVLHSSAALLKIAEMQYTGANSIFIRTLLDKKYALPFRVVDALVLHFVRFRSDRRQMPVLWHQSMLVFVQRYKEDLTPEQKEALLDLIKYQHHDQITPEVRRELTNSKCRDEMMMEGQVSTVPPTSSMAMEMSMRA